MIAVEHRAGLALCRVLLPISLALGLAACGDRSPAPETTAAIQGAPTEDYEAQIARYNKLNEDLRRIRGEERKARKASFEDDYALYGQILDEFESSESRLAAWNWITDAWSVREPGAEPGDLAWDERTAMAIVLGALPQEMTVSLGSGVLLDFAWIDTGIFLMGSPPTETGHNPDERQHRTMASSGFWMAKHEVTQGTWHHVLGSNPSYFKNAGRDAPVEQVSWLDAQVFLLKLNTLIERQPGAWIGSMVRLPREVEWEYACRAGTFGPVYSGPVTILGDNHAPELDLVAWYGGNSGVTYDGGWDTSKWNAKQYPHSRAGTHPVGLKQPNAWGLHDMIGNVWEWCSDSYAPYPEENAEAPAAVSSNRIARGASWGNLAYACRAAIRNPLPVNMRHNRVGFRIAASW